MAIGEHETLKYTDDFNDQARPFNPYNILAIFGGTQADHVFPINLENLQDFGPNIEDEGHTVILHSAVKRKALGAIATEGLVRAHNHVSVMTPVFYEGTFFSERPEHLLRFDRTRNLYARPFPPPIEEIYESDNEDSYIDLELAINPGLVIVTDQQIWDDAREAISSIEDRYPRQALANMVRPYAQYYWSAAKPLSEYLQGRSTFVNPEVLIPFDVPIDQLRLYQPT